MIMINTPHKRAGSFSGVSILNSDSKGTDGLDSHRRRASSLDSNRTAKGLQQAKAEAQQKLVELEHLNAAQQIAW
eukprot:scaffold6456_cov147-Amphora_coffeaeformis.AAC.8